MHGVFRLATLLFMRSARLYLTRVSLPALICANILGLIRVGVV